MNTGKAVYNEKLKRLVLHNLVEAYEIVLSDQCMGMKPQPAHHKLNL